MAHPRILLIDPRPVAGAQVLSWVVGVDILFLVEQVAVALRCVVPAICDAVFTGLGGGDWNNQSS